MTSPLPARDDLSTSANLREGLDALAGLNPDYDVEAGLLRFEAASATGAAAAGGATLKLVLGSLLLVLATAVGGGLLLAGGNGAARSVAVAVAPVVDTQSPGRPAEHSSRVPEVGEVSEGSRIAAVPVEAKPSDQIKIEAPQVTPLPAVVASEPTPQRRPSGRVSRAPVPKPEGPEPLLAEMQILNSTRKQVSSGHFTRALESIAAAHELEFPHHFGEEWEALEILALAGAGRLKDARKLATPYLSRHPRGRFNAPIERALNPKTPVSP